MASLERRSIANSGIVARLWVQGLPLRLRARSQRRINIAISSSRPTSGVRWALARAAPATARPYKPKQCHRLGQPFQFLGAPLLRDEQPGDLALHLRCHNDGTRFSQRLHTCRDVRRIPVNLSRGIHHDRACFDTNACVERRLTRTGVLAVDLSERALNGKGGPRCAFGVVFLGYRIAEQRHEPIAKVFGDLPAHLRHCCRGGIQIRADQIAPVLGIKPRRDAGRTYKIAEHHRNMSAFASGFCDRRGSRRCSRRSNARRGGSSLHGRVITQGHDGIEQLHPVPECGDAKLLQVFFRQARKDRPVIHIEIT
jgi:hypothetical protein